MQKLLLSACLAGQPVRYDGDSKRQQHERLQQLIAENRVVTFCPEMAGGLPVPRDAAEIQGGQGTDVLEGKAKVLTLRGEDVTLPFVAGAQKALRTCQHENIKVAVLTDKSPSCGSIQTYDGNFNGDLVNGDGVTSALLKQHGVQVFNQHQIDEAIEVLNSLVDANANE